MFLPSRSSKYPVSFKSADPSEDNPIIKNICIVNRGTWAFSKNTWHYIPANDENEEVRMRAEKFLDELSILLGYSTIDQMVLDFIQKSKEV